MASHYWRSAARGLRGFKPQSFAWSVAARQGTSVTGNRRVGGSAVRRREPHSHDWCGPVTQAPPLAESSACVCSLVRLSPSASQGLQPLPPTAVGYPARPLTAVVASSLPFDLRLKTRVCTNNYFHCGLCKHSRPSCGFTVDWNTVWTILSAVQNK